MGKEEKALLRAEAIRLRESLGEKARACADRAIAQTIVQSEPFQKAETVFAYCSMGTEVDTRLLIRLALDAGKTVALPRCVRGSRAMTWHAVASLDELAPGFCGILEPAENATLVDPATAGPSAVALVPGLLFDREGYRLGYGGGFYDVFLAAFPGTTIGLVRERQRVENLREAKALEPFDVPVALLASERGLFDTAPTIL